MDIEKAENAGVAMDVQNGARQTEPTILPPTYNRGLLARVKSVKEESGGSSVSYVRGCLSIFCGSVYMIIVLAITLAIPIASIAIGSVYLDDCPRERYIPIYLIVGGVFGAVLQLSRIVHQVVKRDDEEASARPNPLDGIVSCFLLAWFIAGNVWVFRTYGDYTTDDPTAEDYCHPTVYLFAFWLIISLYIMMALSCCCVLMCGLAACFATCATSK